MEIAAYTWMVLERRCIRHDRRRGATGRNLHTYSLDQKISSLNHPALGPGKGSTRSIQLLLPLHIWQCVHCSRTPKSRCCATSAPPPSCWPPRSSQLPPQRGCPLLLSECKQETPSWCGIPIPSSRIIERTGKLAGSLQVVSRSPLPMLTCSAAVTYPRNVFCTNSWHHKNNRRLCSRPAGMLRSVRSFHKFRLQGYLMQTD